MAKKTISQALKDLFLGLGGNESALADNTSASDYIQDLESAIKSSASSVIDDEEASDTTTYSSNKITSLIPEVQDPEYLIVSVSNVTGSVSITLPKGYDRASFLDYAHKKPTICDLVLGFNNWSISIYGKIAFSGITQKGQNNCMVCYHGFARNEIDKTTKYLVTVFIHESDPTKDAVYYEELTTT